MMITTTAIPPIFPRLLALPLAGKAIAPRRRSPTLSRRELARLIADMVD